MTVSVLMPALNAAAWIGEALGSVASQSHPAHEIIVVDDGSTDETAAIAGRFTGTRVLQRPNGGPAAALNDALWVASGDWIAVLDADDVWPPDNLERHLANLSGGSHGGSVGLVTEFLCPSAAGMGARFAPRPPYPGWLPGAMIVRRALFGTVGLFAADLRIGFCIDWIARARLAGVGFALSDHFALRRRLRPHSLSTASAERDRSLLEVARRAIDRRRATLP